MQETPVENSIGAKKADIERRRQEELKNRFGNHIELISSKNNTVIQRNGLFLPNKENYPPQKVPTEKLFEEFDKINAKYDAELKALEEAKKEQPKQQSKYNLTPGIINGYKLNDGRDILFTGEMTPEGPSISIQQTSVFNDIVANKATINGIRISAEQLRTDTSKMSDAQVLDFYLKLLIAKDIQNQNEQARATSLIIT